MSKLTDINKYIEQNQLNISPEYLISSIENLTNIKINQEFIFNELMKNNISWNDIECDTNNKISMIIEKLFKFDEENKTKLLNLNNFNSFEDVENFVNNIDSINSYLKTFNIELSSNEELVKLIKESSCLYNKDGYLIISPNTNFSFDKLCNNNYKLKEKFMNNNNEILFCKTPDGELYKFEKGYEPVDKNGKEFNTKDKMLTSLKIIFGRPDNDFDFKNKENIKNYSYLYPAFFSIHTSSTSDYGTIYGNRKSIVSLLNDKNISNYDECVLAIAKGANLPLKSVIINDIIPEKSKDYKALLVSIIQENPHAIKLLDNKNPYYYELVQEAVKNGFSVSNINEQEYGKKDELWTITTRYDDFHLIPKDLPNIDAIYKHMLSLNGLIIKDISSNTKNYHEYCDIAVQQNGFALNDIDKKFINNDLIEKACKQNGLIIGNIKNFIDNNSKDYFNFCKIAVKQNPEAISYIGNPYRDELCMLITSESSLGLKALLKNVIDSKNLYNNNPKYKDYILNSVTNHSESIKYVSSSVENYFDLAKISIYDDINNIEFIKYNPFKNEEKEKYFQLAMQVIKEDWKLLDKISPYVDGYKDLCNEAVKQNPEAKYFIKEINPYSNTNENKNLSNKSNHKLYKDLLNQQNIYNKKNNEYILNY